MAKGQARVDRRPVTVGSLLARWVLAVSLLAWAGCTHTVTVGARVLSPASVPVLAFPEIWVAGGYLEEDEDVLSRLLEALGRDGEHRVVRVDPDHLEPLRRAGRIPIAAVVLIVDVRILEDTRQSIDTVPVRVCGSYGCDTQYQQVTSDVPWIRGVAVLQVHEGPSARLLQRHVVRTDRYGGDPFALRTQVARRLASEVAAAVDVREQLLEVRFFEVDLPAVQAAQARIVAGDWPAGRALLEQVVSSAQLQALPAEEQAQVFYNLGLARRFAPTGDYSEQGFALSEQALERAAELDPEQRAYPAALRDLAKHRAAHAQLLAQREAAKQNFSLQSAGAAVPAPPASYGTPAVQSPGEAPLIPPAPPATNPTPPAPPDSSGSDPPPRAREEDFEPG